MFVRKVNSPEEGGNYMNNINGNGFSLAEEMEMQKTRFIGRNPFGGESHNSLLLAVVLAASIIFYLLKKTKKDENRPLPPGPRGVPLLGSLPFLEPNLHTYFAKLTDTYGPIMSLRLGAKLCVVLSSPEAAKEALTDKDAIFANHEFQSAAQAFPYFGKDLVFSPYGPHWRMIRKVTALELLSPRTINGLYSVRRIHVQKMVDEIRGKAGQLVNIRELTAATIMNIMMEMLWGGSAADNGMEKKSLEREFQLMLEEMVSVLSAPNISDFYPAIAWLDLQGLARRMRRVAAWFDSIFDPLIEKRLSREVEAEKSKRDFLQVLVDRLSNPDVDEPMTVDTVKGLLLDMMTGATDTSSTTVEWAITELLHNPDVMARVKEEIAAVVGKGNTVEESHFPKLPYLDAVVKETLRLHPVAPLLIPRRTSSSCIVGGYRIPEGTQVFINAWVIQRDDRLWEDAPKFKPERFLEGDRADGFRYLPFGAGRRICPGLALGERVLKFIVASLVHSAEWTMPEGSVAADDLKEKFGIIMRKKKPLCATPSLC